ncbi:universal stress protein [Streptomyces sp. FIT100]|uniref:universal stress protein n=1 Tax=Streptomyces sp. FIT100 TaxID=2837956 RepID=UPI0021C98202|nr:universal stress protein [Streptomyces sp. FIT100]UUN30652.1 universal stress protein [Streptomyces sp. FIT100]
MESPLVIGIDGSPPSLDAVDWAVSEAALRGLPVRLVYASRWQRYEGAVPQDPTERPSEQELIDALVADAVQRARRRDAAVRIATDVLAEDTVMSLVGESRHAAMVVIGSRGRGGLSGLLLGSVSLGVAARAHCPVIVVRGDKAGREGTHGRVLLGVADAGEGADATRFAFREAAKRRSELEAVRAWRRPLREVLRETVGHPRPADDPGAYHAEEAATQIETAVAEGVRDHPGLALRHSAVEGPPHKVLVQRSAAADLVVVGARRRQGHFGLQLGRVAHAVLHHGECPVAVVPEHDVPSTTAAAKEI